MNPLATLKIPALFIALLSVCHGQDMEVKGENVRVIRYKDGSQAQFERSDNNRTIVKKTFPPNGGKFPSLVTVYRMDSTGNPMSCKIFDGGQREELFKVSYGYRKSDGQLVEERMFDSRVRRISPDNKDIELPVQRVIYLYNAEGKRSAPIPINLLPGKTFEEVYGSPSSALDNPFDKDPKGANPQAKPVGR